ncbi:MAG: hypothetical protein ACRDHD_08490 [Candidatus Limnocylindria bacterium]
MRDLLVGLSARTFGIAFAGAAVRPAHEERKRDRRLWYATPAFVGRR